MKDFTTKNIEGDEACVNVDEQYDSDGSIVTKLSQLATTTTETSPQLPDNHMLNGLLLIAASGFIFSIATVLTAIVGRNLASFQIIFISGFVRWIVLYSMVFQTGEPMFGPRELRPLILLRCWCGFIGFSCATYSFTKMPIGDATSIVFSSPAWASIFSRIFLKEPFTCADRTAVALSLVGVVLVSRPSFIFGQTEETTDVSAHVSKFERIFVPFVAMLGSIGAGGAAVCVRRIGMKGGIKPVVLAQMYALATFLWSPFGFFLPGQTPNVDQITIGPVVLAIVVGVLGSAYQYMFNTGAMRVPAGLGSMMRNTDIVMSFVWQVVIFGQQITLLSVFGSLLIIMATVGIAIKKLREDQKSKKNIEPNMQLVSQDSQIDDLEVAPNHQIEMIEGSGSSFTPTTLPEYSSSSEQALSKTVVTSPMISKAVSKSKNKKKKADSYTKLGEDDEDDEDIRYAVV